MSRSNAPKQATINKWVNAEAVRCYADGLDAQAEQIRDYEWPDDPTEKQAAAAEALAAAAVAVRVALNRATEADRMASEVHYDRIYNRV